MFTQCDLLSPSPKHKLRVRCSHCHFCCFTATTTAATNNHRALDCKSPSMATMTRPRSPCAWLRSAVHDLPEIRYKCRSLIARIGKYRRQNHGASDFGYDPLSYALNFEDDRSRESDEEFPVRNFSARLPASPDRLLRPPANMPREVVACS